MRSVTIDINGEAVPAVLGVPASGKGPAVIVIQEWWGLVPHIGSLVERFADEGYVALAVDHYRGAATTEPDEARKLMLGLRIPQVAADLAAAADWLLSRDEVVGGQVRVVGFCMGGGLALLGPTVSDAICCSVAFYPAMSWPDYDPNWARYAGKHALIHKAESDEEAHGPKIAEYAAAISAAGGSADIRDYPNSKHAFFNDSRPEVYEPENAEAAWSATLGFFREYEE